MTTPAAPPAPAPPATGAPVQDLYKAAFSTAMPELEKIWKEGGTAVEAPPVAPAVTPPVTPPVAPPNGDPVPPVAPPETPPVEAPPAETPPADPPAPEMIRVELPPRRPEEQPVVIELPPEAQEAIDALRHLNNSFRRGSELDVVEHELERERAEHEDRVLQFTVDPLAVLEGSNATERAGIALMLLADLDVLTQAQENLSDLLNEERRAEARALLIEERATWQKNNADRLRQARANADLNRDTNKVLQLLTPPGLDEAGRAQFQRYARAELVEEITQRRRTNPRAYVHPFTEAPRLLEPLATRFGLTAEQLTQAKDHIETVARGGRPPRRPSAAPVKAAPPAASAAPAKPSIEQIQAAAGNRPPTAAPPGAGAPAVALPQIAKGTKVEDALKLFRAAQLVRPN